LFVFIFTSTSQNFKSWRHFMALMIIPEPLIGLSLDYNLHCWGLEWSPQMNVRIYREVKAKINLHHNILVGIDISMWVVFFQTLFLMCYIWRVYSKQKLRCYIYKTFVKFLNHFLISSQFFMNYTLKSSA
jgi:hypothetical protein